MIHPCSRGKARRGVAMVWVLVVLAVVTLFTAEVARQFVLARRAAREDQNQAQALWLARGGLELATARLLTAPERYTGETFKPLPQSEVTITVAKHPSLPDHYRIVSTAHYPAGEARKAVREMRCTVRRILEPNGTRIERVADPMDQVP